MKLNSLLMLVWAINVNCTYANEPMAEHSSSAQSLQTTLSVAINQFENTERADWSYRVTRYENEEGDVTSSIEVHDATKPIGQRWRLERINGDKPSDKQQQQLRAKKAERAASNNSITVRLRDIIQLDTAIVHSETTNELTAGFDVWLPEYGELAAESLTGTLIFNKQQAFIEQIRITNTKSFSPILTANIEHFVMTLSFQKIEHAVLLRENALEMRGTFAFFTEINEVSSDVFSEYRFAGE